MERWPELIGTFKTMEGPVNDAATDTPTSAAPKQRRPSKLYDTGRWAKTVFAMKRRPQEKQTTNDPIQDFDISVNVRHGSIARPCFDSKTPATVSVTLDVMERWTIKWSGIEGVLQSGICFLFEYPKWEHAMASHEGLSAGLDNDDEQAAHSGRGNADEQAGHRVMPTSKGKASARTLESMETLILELVKQTTVSKLADASGARLIHALLVANTKESLELAQKLIELRPRLLLVVHTKCEHRRVRESHLERHLQIWAHREVDEAVARRTKDIAIYEGEGSLHILAANRKEELICKLLEHASKHYSDKELIQLLSQRAVGIFFSEPPMCNFGLTPVAYFAARKLRRPLLLLFATRDVDRLLALGGPEEMSVEMAKGLVPPLEPPLLGRDEITRQRLVDGDLAQGWNADEEVNGRERLMQRHRHINLYAPLHAVVATDDTDMFDLLVKCCGARAEGTMVRGGSGALHQLAGDDRVEEVVTRGESRMIEPLALRDHFNCTPLQLAAWLGSRRMFRHMLRDRTVKVWQWGPVSEHQIPLNEIDSAESYGERRVMELICHSSASENAKMMLDESFMQGFLFALYQVERRSPLARPAHM